MPGLDLPLPQLIAVTLIPALLAIIVHEVAHGWVARWYGDHTAELMGRLTLNPIKHIDPIGTLAVPLLLIVLKAGIIFGWAKPVPVNWNNLRNPKRDMVLVAAAGPAANLLMAIMWALALKLAASLPETAVWVAEPLIYMGYVGILINAVLMVFNLFPLPPLDGGRVAVGLLPLSLARPLARVEPYGFFILIALLFTGVLWTVIQPVIGGVVQLVRILTGV